MKPITSTLTLSLIRCHWLFHRIFNPWIIPEIAKSQSRNWEVVPRLQTQSTIWVNTAYKIKQDKTAYSAIQQPK